MVFIFYFLFFAFLLIHFDSATSDLLPLIFLHYWRFVIISEMCNKNPVKKKEEAWRVNWWLLISPANANHRARRLSERRLEDRRGQIWYGCFRWPPLWYDVAGRLVLLRYCNHRSNSEAERILCWGRLSYQQLPAFVFSFSLLLAFSRSERNRAEKLGFFLIGVWGRKTE